MKEYFEEFKEKAKNEYITINKDQFAQACANIVDKFLEQDESDMAMLVGLIGAAITTELFDKGTIEKVVRDE